MPNQKFATSKDVLLFDYNSKKSKNSRFSKRSYAKLLGISSGRLTEILNGKAPLTEKKAQSIVNKLGLEPYEKQYFLRLVENENLQRTERRGRSRYEGVAPRRLKMDEVVLVQDWEYFALMSLIEVSTFKSDRKWIAKKLGLSLARTDEVLQRLVSMGFVRIDQNNKISNVHRSMSTLTDIPSEALRKANASCILQGLEKMNTVDVLSRDITSMTFPVDLQNLKEAKKLIREFKSKMARVMKRGKTSEIYNLNVQLVPVSELGV
ncbi:DUF4423 domain-containing protein [Bdellovibrio bacteriovorus]|uniref:DUF4423 domain-containing protein n=1 Tax=Bdellovibrio bacteriovorus TaxID=959 RepID=UPI0021CFAA6A|nr:DUF4423 domain-containing protein [Bdellovibrio bacteriovorus]UXR64547.1 DUF4423 domain-containing protein [Bdellovibrio bacteriovorus]